ncbi:SAV_915 family protein [Dactylosporangium cerinum]
MIRTGCRPRGARVGIAFTGPDRLVAAMGPRQQWTRLSESALREMLRPLGIDDIQVDPILVGPRITPASARLSRRERVPGGAVGEPASGDRATAMSG